MAINLNSLSRRELDALIEQARKRRTTLDKRKPAATVRNRLTALAKAEGYTIDELFGGGAAAAAPGVAGTPRKAGSGKAATGKSASAKGRKLGKVAPKYRNPVDPAQTWSGRGMQPKWLAALTQQGAPLEDFLIG